MSLVIGTPCVSNRGRERAENRNRQEALDLDQLPNHLSGEDLHVGETLRAGMTQKLQTGKQDRPGVFDDDLFSGE